MTSKRKSLLELADAGLAAVQPRTVLSAALLQQAPAGECYVLVIGKAAAGMYDAAAGYLGARLLDGRVVLPESSRKPAADVVTLVGEHPVPGEGSFAAGKEIHAWLQHLDAGIPLLLLLSGGGSALLEMPVANVSTQQCRDIHAWCLGSGLPINTVNAIRSRFSALKSGGLAAAAGRRDIFAYVISDIPANTPKNDLRYVASGPASAELVQEFDRAVKHASGWIRELAETAGDVPRKSAGLIRLADNATVLKAIVAAVGEQDFDVIEQGGLSGDAESCARAIAARIADAPSGLYLFGGETTVSLPDNPGRGGRNQQLALALADAMQGRDDWYALALATDGVDGNSEDAGALVDGGTIRRGEDAGLDAGTALSSANAGEFLEAAGDLVHTGPTGTNVMDLLLVLKE